jgi:hypothetical protein
VISRRSFIAWVLSLPVIAPVVAKLAPSTSAVSSLDSLNAITLEYLSAWPIADRLFTMSPLIKEFREKGSMNVEGGPIHAAYGQPSWLLRKECKRHAGGLRRLHT